MSVRVRFPPEAQEGRLPPSLLCYCPSPQPLSLAERGGAHALSAPADRASAVPLVLLPLSQPLPQDRIAAGNHTGRTRAALPVQFCFRSFTTIPSTAPPEPSHRLCPKTELQPKTMQEGHGRHSLCNSFRSFPPNTFREDATSEIRRRRRGPGTRRRRGGSNEGIHP